MIEAKKQTQKERLFELFQRAGTLSNYELRAMQPPMFQYPVRIKELRDEGKTAGFTITTERDKNDRRKFLYTFKRTPAPPSDLFDPYTLI